MTSLTTPSAKELSRQLDDWLSSAGLVHGPARAIISPHAGYQYCGSCAAHAWKQVDPSRVRRVFVLGPSHHVRLGGCALSPAQTYKTPLGDLLVDREVYKELFATSVFEEMTLTTDEEEHSLEMHLPFISHVFRDRDVKIVPIMVGSLSFEKQSMYGRILSKYLALPDSLFVVSSDFCHWGARFHYQFYDKAWGAICESVQKLDELGMRSIESLDALAFNSYLKKYGNTICGRHPIGVLLSTISDLKGQQMSLQFLNYAQSSACRSMEDSSVSYAAASLVLKDN